MSDCSFEYSRNLLISLMTSGSLSNLFNSSYRSSSTCKRSNNTITSLVNSIIIIHNIIEVKNKFVLHPICCCKKLYDYYHDHALDNLKQLLYIESCNLFILIKRNYKSNFISFK